MEIPRCLSRFLGFDMPVLAVTVATLLFQSSALASENLSLLDQALDKVRARGLYFRVDLSLEVFNATDEVPTVLLNTSTPVTAPINTAGSTSTGSGGSVTLTDSSQSNLSSLVNVIGAGSVINVGVNVLNITNSSSDTIYTTNTNYGVLGGASSPTPVVP